MSAKFPTAIATDSDLLVAVNRAQTTLASPMGAGDATATLTSGAAFPLNCVIVIDAEAMLITANGGTNTPTVQRAYDGTSAATHAAGAQVSAFIVAHHHSQVSLEIQAIESALGTNLANIVQASGLKAGQYNFTPQQPGGSLAVGANTITFPNGLPSGITANSVGNHNLYISGGAGTAEAVPIVGVNVGANQVTVTCAFTHTGAWTIGSATGGIQEAIIATGGSGRVWMSAGDTTLRGPVLVPGTFNISLRGFGQGVTRLLTNGGLAGDWIYFKVGGAYIDLGGFTITDASTTFHTSGSMIRVAGKAQGLINNIEIECGYDGLVMDTCPGTVTLDSLHIGTQRHAIYITTFGVNYPTVNQSGCSISNARLANVTDACIQIEGPITSIPMVNVSAASTPPSSTNYCLQIVVDATNPSGEITFSNCIFDSSGNAVRLIGPSTPSYNENWIIFDGCELNATEAAFFVSGAIQNVYWNGGLIKASGGAANLPVNIVTNGTGIPRNIQIRHASLYGTGTSAFTVNGATSLVISGITVGNEGSGPTTFLTIQGTVTGFIQGCDFSNCSVAKIAQSGGASFANIRVVDMSNAFAFADLVALANGSLIMVSNGTVANPVAGGGTGCLAKRLNGVWVGN